MSYGQFVHLDRQERLAADRQRRTIQQAQRQRAKALVDEHFGADDEFWQWAVMAVLNLWHKHGEGKVTLGQVKAERARLLRRLESHGPNAARRPRPADDELDAAA